MVQCKHWKAQDVGVRHIREFLGTLTDVGSQKGIFITSRHFTEDARALAQKHNIQILDERETLRLLEEVNWKGNPGILSALDPSEKICPKCESRMVLRTAKKSSAAGKQFWGCSSFPKCHYILEHFEEQSLSAPATTNSKAQQTELKDTSPAQLAPQSQGKLDPKIAVFIVWTVTYLGFVGLCTFMVMRVGNAFMNIVPFLKTNIIGFSILIGFGMGTTAFLELRRALKRRR